MTDHVFCPECRKEDRKSYVCPGLATETAMWCPAFYDEEGRLHHHDLNITTQAFTCSNGHSWETRTGGSCWCGWPEGEANGQE